MQEFNDTNAMECGDVDKMKGKTDQEGDVKKWLRRHTWKEERENLLTIQQVSCTEESNNSDKNAKKCRAV